MGGALLACGTAAGTVELLSRPPGPTALNAQLILRLDGDVDPLGVTALSVDVLRDDGRSLPARVGTSAGGLLVELIVTPELLADAPPSALVRLAGLPSMHALRTTDGRRLRAPAALRWPLNGRLQGSNGASPRLLEVDGRPLPLDGPVAADGPLRLLFEGIVDPGTVSPETCPLYPLEHGLTLATPLLPRVGWRCIGDRFELVLDLGQPHGTLELNLRRFGLRDFSGRSPEPPLKTEVRAS